MTLQHMIRTITHALAERFTVILNGVGMLKKNASLGEDREILDEVERAAKESQALIQQAEKLTRQTSQQ